MSTSKNNKPLRQVINERMIELMEYSIYNGIVESRADWCKQIGFSYRGFSQIAHLKQGFTDEQKLAAAQLVGADMNWIFGLEKTMVLKRKKDPTVQDLLEEALRQVGKRKTKAK